MKCTPTLPELAAFASLSSAHFNLNYPAARGFDEGTLPNFPCGGQNAVSSNRTLWPISGGSIALTMGHIDANVEVLIGFGNDPGSSFSTILRPTFSETGLGAFCMTGLDVPSDMATDGMNATIQVVTNGDPDSGLYNCADITFSSTAPQPASGVCTNQTGVSVTTATVTGNPNGTGSASESSTNGTKSAGNIVGAGVSGFALAGMAVLAVVL